MCPALVLGFGVLLPWAYAWVPGQHYTQSEELFLVGGSCDAGWSTDKALQFSRPDPNRHLFTIIAGLKTDGFGFKMLRSRSGWNDDVGMLAMSWSTYGPLGYGAQGKLEQAIEQNIPPPAVKAIYNLTVDMDAGVWWYICVDLCGRIADIMPSRIAPLRQVTLLYSGKLRGRLLPYSETTGNTCTKEAAVLPDCIGGLPNIAAYARKLSGEGKNVVLVDAGEFFFGGDAFSAEAAGELARLAGYKFLNANARDFQRGAAGFKEFAKALGPNVSVVLSNGDSQTLNEKDPSLGRSFVVGYGAVEVSPGFKVGVLGFSDDRASLYLDDLSIDSVVSNMMPKLHALRRQHNPFLVVLMNSLNNDGMVDDVAQYLLGSQVVLGGTGTSKPPLSLLPFGPFLNYGWLSSYGGKELQQLDITVNAKGDIVDSRYSSARMDASVVNLTSNDPVLTRAYELFVSQSGGSANSELIGHSNVDFFYEGDPSRCAFSREQAPVMYLLTRVLYEKCITCSAVFLNPDLVDHGLEAGPITLSALKRVFPRSSDETMVDVIEVSGAQLIEGVKDLFAGLGSASLARGLRLSLLNTEGFPTPVTAIQVDVRSGGYVNLNRTQMYRIALPRWHKIRKFPSSWAIMQAVQELGQLSDLFASFIQEHSPLGPEFLGPFGVVKSLTEFKVKIAPCTDRPLREVWDLGCAFAFGAYQDVKEMLAPCDAGETLRCLDCFYGGTYSNFQCVSCDPGSMRIDVDERSGKHFWSLRFTKESLAMQPFSCSPCQPGMYRGIGMPPTHCELCHVDTFVNASGSTTCDACPSNTHQQDRGQTWCQCDLSFFKNQSDISGPGSTLPCLACSEVVAGSTTRYPGARGRDHCQCPQGTFVSNDIAGGCQTCPEGMVCLFGSDTKNFAISTNEAVPVAAPGFMTLPHDSLEAYKCIPSGPCLDKSQGQCAAHNDDTSVACGRCEAGAFMGEDGICVPCDGSAEKRVAEVVVILVVALLVLPFMVNRDIILNSRSSRDVATLLGTGTFALQIFGTFDGSSFTDVGPIAAVARACRSFTLDVKFLHLECMSDIHPAGSFALAQATPPVSFLFIVVVITIKKFVKRNVNFPSECTNTVGTACQLVFIAILYNCIRPLVCYAHPGGRHASVRNYPSVLCFESREHERMLWVGALSFFAVPLPFVALNVVAILKYPTMITRGSGINFLQGTRFLFRRFRPAVFYYGCVLLARSLSFCLVPLFFRDKPAVQLWAIVAIFSLFILVQQTLRPWTSDLINIVDGALSAMLVLLALSGASQDLTVAAEDMNIICNITAITAASVVFLPIVDAIVRSCRSKVMYGFFVCHHKVDAAAQSRLLKMLLDKVSRRPTFLDSDHLQDLDLLFDIVKFKTGALVVYLTSRTLTRPWCAGEITSAHANNVPVFAVVTPSFVKPTSAELASLADYVDFTGFKAAVYGISLSRMSAALAWFCGSIAVGRFEVNMEDSIIQRCSSIIEFVLKNKRLRYTSFMGYVSTSLGHGLLSVSQPSASPMGASAVVSGVRSNRPCMLACLARFGSWAATPRMRRTQRSAVGSVLVSADTSDDEAVAGAQILMMFIEMQVFLSEGARLTVLSEGDCHSAELKDTIREAHGLIVILSAGTLNCLAQLRAICEGMIVREELDKLAVVTAASPSFCFPREEALDKILPSEYLIDPNKRLQLTNLFKLIVCPLGLDNSSTVLSTHCDTIRRRIQSFASKTRPSGTPKRSGGVECAPVLEVAALPNPLGRALELDATSTLGMPEPHSCPSVWGKNEPVEVGEVLGAELTSADVLEKPDQGNGSGDRAARLEFFKQRLRSKRTSLDADLLNELSASCDEAVQEFFGMAPLPFQSKRDEAFGEASRCSM